jgi:hypothetical protein
VIEWRFWNCFNLKEKEIKNDGKTIRDGKELQDKREKKIKIKVEYMKLRKI